MSRHLSTRAVEWLRASTWQVTYMTPTAMPACWGLLHPGRGLEPPTWAREILNQGPPLRSLTIAQWVFRDTPSEIFLGAWPSIGERALTLEETRSLHLPDEMLKVLREQDYTGVADVRAIVRGMTSNASSKVWEWRNGGETSREARPPTCTTCSVLYDEELPATHQKWVEPPGWKSRRRQGTLKGLGAVLADDGTITLTAAKKKRKG